MLVKALELLKKQWGHKEFRPLQEEIVTAVLEQRDTLALLPTGGGKSLCYQLPALLREGITLVISPLLSLMSDQVAQLNARGIKAMYIPGGTKHRDLIVLLDNCVFGNYKLLYLSPERLQQELVLERIKQMNINLLAVDEAHCISQWGHDFRPAYRAIGTFREALPDVNCLALTATATNRVATDITEQLRLKNPALFKSSFIRENLAYIVLEEEDKYYRLQRILKQKKRSAIVYVRSRKTAQKYCDYLNNQGIGAHFYHGGLGNDARDSKFKDWMEDRVQVMVATTAFGMGIDKPDVQTIVHVELPDSIENYFQEAGRAGRDGRPAGSIILKAPGDAGRLKNQFIKVLPEAKYVLKIYKKLNSYFRISYGAGDQEHFKFNFIDFCQTYELPSRLTYNALQLLDSNSVISLNQEFFSKASLQIIVSPVTLTYNLIKNPGADRVVKSILRTYAGIFDQHLEIDHASIAKKANESAGKVHQVLLQLEKDNLVSYKYKSYDTALTFLVPREDEHVIHRIAREIKIQNNQKTQRVAALLNYVDNDQTCRSIQLLAYFDEKRKNPCGNCDVCRAKKSIQAKSNDQLSHQILDLLQAGERSSRSICETFHTVPDEVILQELRTLLAQKNIKLTEKNTYSLKK